MSKQLNKAEQERQKVLALLDAEDANVLTTTKQKATDFDKLFEASMK